MNLDDVRELDLLLQARGQALSANKLTEHLGGSKRDALRLLQAYRAETPAPPPPLAPAVAVLEPAMLPEDSDPVSAPPVPLLQQAEEALRQALAEEHKIRRGVQDPAQPLTWDCFERCQQAMHQAQAQVDKLQRSTATLIAAIPAARIDARRTAGALAELEDEMRRRLIRARREAQQAKDQLDQMIQDMTSIAGRQAVPPED